MSDQFKKKQCTKCSGRYSKLTPTYSLVRMNDLVGRIVEHRLDMLIDNNKATHKPPNNIDYDLFGSF